MTAPALQQLNLVVRDVATSVAFYRQLGIPVESGPESQHVELVLPNGVSIEWDSIDTVAMWDTGWRRSGTGGVVLGFSLDSRAAVDEKYGELVAAGYPGHQPPYDTFWGSRYAIVEDPDGNSVGLMSPIEESRKFWPNTPPPVAPRPAPNNGPPPPTS